MSLQRCLPRVLRQLAASSSAPACTQAGPLHGLSAPSTSDGCSSQHQQLLLLRGQHRAYAAPAADAKKDDAGADAIGNERVRKLAEDVMGLTVLEASWLAEILRKKLNMQKPAYGAMPAMQFAMPAAAPAAAAPAAEKKEEKAAEKTEFNVKLESYSAEGKIKVIKEVRAITTLGLKEAKELVEKAPVVFKSGISKADAEAIKKQLESVGAKVTLE